MSEPARRLFHKWVNEIADYFNAGGKTEFSSGTPLNRETMKRNIKRTFLGTELLESINLLTGEVNLTEEVRETRKLKAKEWYEFLSQVEQWADSLQIPISKPDLSSYEKYKEANQDS